MAELETASLGFEAFRAAFPAAERGVYLDVASCGPISTLVRRAVDHHLADFDYGRDKTAMLAAVERARGQVAALINATADEIAITKNVSDGLNCIANTFDWKPGDNVVVCLPLEHANNRYPWLHLCQRYGVEMRSMPAPAGSYPIDAMLAAIDRRTRLVTVSSVSYLPGFRTPLDALARACRERDAFLLVDGAQSVGPLHTDVRALPIDALAMTTQKGLLGLYGMGFLYVQRDRAERMVPSCLSRSSLRPSPTDGAVAVNEDLAMQAGARRFDLGNYNVVGAIAAATSIALLRDLGTRAIESHNLSLALRLREGMARLGLPVCQPPTDAEQSHVVTMGTADAGETSDEARHLDALYRHLQGHGVRLSRRGAMLRLSVHAFNNADDVDQAVALAREFAAVR